MYLHTARDLPTPSNMIAESFRAEHFITEKPNVGRDTVVCVNIKRTMVRQEIAHEDKAVSNHAEVAIQSSTPSVSVSFLLYR